MNDIKRMKKEELIEEIEKKNEELSELKKQQAKLEKYKQYEEAADEMMAVKQAFVDAGFNDTEAFTLLMKCLERAGINLNTCEARRPMRP